MITQNETKNYLLFRTLTHEIYIQFIYNDIVVYYQKCYPMFLILIWIIVRIKVQSFDPF